jgi:hypothetical protein
VSTHFVFSCKEDGLKNKEDYFLWGLYFSSTGNFELNAFQPVFICKNCFTFGMEIKSKAFYNQYTSYICLLLLFHADFILRQVVNIIPLIQIFVAPDKIN